MLKDRVLIAWVVLAVSVTGGVVGAALIARSDSVDNRTTINGCTGKWIETANALIPSNGVGGASTPEEAAGVRRLRASGAEVTEEYANNPSGRRYVVRRDGKVVQVLDVVRTRAGGTWYELAVTTCGD